MSSKSVRVCPECDTRTEAERCPKDGRLTVDEGRLKIRAKDPNIGTVIEGKYELVSRLGRGGMGSVYKAVHKETGGHVAIKIMRSDMVEDEGAIRRFYIEAQNTHKLHHPNTVRVSDFGQTDDGILFLVMEYVKGRSMRRILKDEGRMAPARAVHVMSQVFKSLGEAHEHGVVHRDIKPDNIMLLDQFGEPDFVKVLDFGISRTPEGTGASTKGAIGTPKYMAPEQWRGQRIDGRADLYACGCVLYRMLTGQLPFEVESKGNQQVVGYMTAHLNDVAKPLSIVIPGVVPPELEALVTGLLAKNRDDRPEDAQAALKRLRWIEKNCELTESVSPPPLPTAAKTEATQGMKTLPTPTAVLGKQEIAEELPLPSERAPGDSGTEFPGMKPSDPESNTPVFIAAALFLALVGGIGLWTTASTDDLASIPPTVASPTVALEVPSESAAAGAPVEATASETPQAEATTRRSLTITPANGVQATVHTVEGELLGTTPMTLARLSTAADPQMTVLPNDSERALASVTLRSEGFYDHTLALDFPTDAGQEARADVTLHEVRVIKVDATKAGIKVRQHGTEPILGETPFAWTVPRDIHSAVRANQVVALEFLGPGEPTQVRVTVAHLDGSSELRATLAEDAPRKGPRKRPSKPKKSKKPWSF